jgi:hypothetical protein
MEEIHSHGGNSESELRCIPAKTGGPASLLLMAFVARFETIHQCDPNRFCRRA